MSSAASVVRTIAHTRGANFSLGFRLLPKDKRAAVYAAYAACRIPDDIVDEIAAGGEPGSARTRLDVWVEELEATYRGAPTLAATRALAVVLERFPIPKHALLGLVEGCRMDLECSRYSSYAELERYCELVAVTISDISLAIFGTVSARANEFGRDLALALQLTNICRDVGEDVARGRIYVPLDEVARFGVTEGEIVSGDVSNARYRALMAFQCDRAREHFRAANPLPETIEVDSRPAVRVMGGVYRRVLGLVAADPVRAYSRRAELSRRQRLTAILAGYLRRPFVF